MFDAYDDHGYDADLSSNALVNYYHAVNFESGHERGCGYGAGADCSCRRGEFKGFVIRIEIPVHGWIVVEAERDHKIANRRARSWQGSGVRTRKIRYTCETFHESDESFYELRETAQYWRDRLDDWNSD